MSLFPRSMFTSDLPRFPSGEFTPLFRLLDDYASHQLSRTGEAPTGLKSFQPKFDVKETKETYELHGELPGIEQDDVQIEFSDATTLTIKGRTERHTESGTPPSGSIQATPEQSKLTEAGEQSSPSPSHETEHYHQPTVEDETAAPASSTAVAQSQPDSTQQTIQQQQQQQQPKKQTSHHYWLSERSIGEFQRSFAFPARVDHDGVRASLRNGILSIVVPKSQAPTTRRIVIE